MSLLTNRHLTCFLIASIVLVVAIVPVCFAVTSDEAQSALDQAEGDLSSAFVAVAAAGDSGANVASLLERLSIAGGYLSEANVAFRVGDYETAYSKSVACSNSLGGVVDEAMRLQAAMENARSERMLYNIVGAGVGLALLLFLGLVGWNYLEKWYRKRVMSLKPVLGDQD